MSKLQRFLTFKPRALTASASADLDLIRAVAAWAVMWGHLRVMFFLDLPYVRKSSPLVKFIYLVTGFGHQAVVVFFVLSGFLVSSAVIKRHATGKWSWGVYASDRLSRLYVVLIPGLLLGLLWDRAGSSLFASSGLYSHPLDGFGDLIVNQRLTVKAFLSNSLFLQTITSPTFGSNGPLWSLANEYWYYVLFPVLLTASLAWANKMFRRAIVFSTLAVCIAVFVKSTIMAGFLIWMGGCLLVVAYSKFSVPAKQRTSAVYTLISSLLLLASLMAARGHYTSELVSDWLIGITFSLFLFGILTLPFHVREERYSTFAHFVAGFSYSVYVLHFPILMFFKAWMVPSQKWEPDMPHLLYGTAVGTAVLTFAWLLSLGTENKTHVARSWINRLLPQVGTAPIANSIGLREGPCDLGVGAAPDIVSQVYTKSRSA